MLENQENLGLPASRRRLVTRRRTHPAGVVAPDGREGFQSTRRRADRGHVLSGKIPHRFGKLRGGRAGGTRRINPWASVCIV